MRLESDPSSQIGQFDGPVPAAPTVLNFAIQTTPPPPIGGFSAQAHSLNLELFQLYLNANALDLARDRLQLVVDTSQSEDFGVEVRAQLKQQLDDLDQQMKMVEDSLIELEAERQAGPIEQASFALSRRGRPGYFPARRRRT